MRKLELNPSQRVVRALQSVRPDILTRGFRRKVLDAIFNDGVASEFDDEQHRSNLLKRLNRRWGEKTTKQLLIAKCEALAAWNTEDRAFVPDAYLVDPKNKTVVCYEIEDTHPLDIHSINVYGDAWFTLEYIRWDLHLIAYDVYGNSRIISLRESVYVARELHNLRQRSRARQSLP